ncbi:MAG: hypothetical protein P1V35_17635 [Planctomycetota bacterium]|nr:hypothetical protein [Planctomycetota bacterium]
MMNHQWTAALIGAAVLGIPAVASQQGDPMRSLKAALDSTHSALSELVGLEPRLAAKDPEAITRLLDLTEPAQQSPEEVDRSVVRLRADMQRLQNALDQGPSENGSAMPSQPTPGLQPFEIGQLAGPTNPVQPQTQTPQVQPKTDVRSMEAPGYSANQMLEAKLLVRTNKHGEAILILRKLTATPESRYWLARALQGVGDNTESRDLLRALSAEGAEAHRYARWAAQDLRMIELREKLSQQTAGENKANNAPATKDQN